MGVDEVLPLVAQVGQQPPGLEDADPHPPVHRSRRRLPATREVLGDGRVAGPRHAVPQLGNRTAEQPSRPPRPPGSSPLETSAAPGEVAGVVDHLPPRRAAERIVVGPVPPDPRQRSDHLLGSDPSRAKSRLEIESRAVPSSVHHGRTLAHEAGSRQVPMDEGAGWAGGPGLDHGSTTCDHASTTADSDAARSTCGGGPG